MGKGILRRRKMSQMAEQVRHMREDTQKIIADPEGAFQKMAKPLLAQLESSRYEKNKLSALVCALLEAQGGKVTIVRSALDRFQNHRITVLSEPPEGDDGINPDAVITFTYEAKPVESQQSTTSVPPTEPIRVLVE